MSSLLTPRQVAESLGVSESSLKRWCDRGLLAVSRTPGGHRRLTLANVVEFVRSAQHEFVAPEAIGLPSLPGKDASRKASPADAFYDAVAKDDLPAARRIVFDSYFRGRSLAEVFDEIIATAMRRAGEDWACGVIEVYQEHRACELVIRIVRELQQLSPPPAKASPVAIGAAYSGDPYCLPTLMVESVLAAEGWRAISLGSDLPIRSLSLAIEKYQPRMVWLSASGLTDEDRFVAEYQEFYSTLGGSVSVVVGGRALTAEVRSRIRYASYCDNLQQLVEFASALNPVGRLTEIS